jgi:polyisoprenoid-binding protein YceI
MDRTKRQFSPRLVATAALLATVSFSLIAAAKLSKTGGAEGGFHAKGPAGLAIDGRTSEVEIADDGTTVTITVRLAYIDTGMSLRNDHMKEDLEVTKYPTAAIRVARSGLKIGGGNGDAKGSLTIHGVTKDVTFHYDATKAGDTLSVKGSTSINVNDYGVKPRTYAGITIKPDVAVYANFQAKDN